MTRTLIPTISTPERQLVFGMEGVGKSNNLLQLARAIPDKMFYVADIDKSPSYRRALETEFTDLQNVDVEEADPDDWVDMLDVVRRVAGKAGVGDWTVADSMSPPWQAIQNWYLDRRFPSSGLDADVEAYFGNRARGRDDIDWVFVNSQYAKLSAALFRSRGHLYLTAEQKVLGDKESKANVMLFGALGVKAVGQKGLGHSVQTVLHMSVDRKGARMLTTLKDRNRTRMDMCEVHDYGKDYLMKVGGWKMGVVQ